MPPRKRAASAPQPDSDTEPLTEDGTEQQDSGAEGGTATAPPDDTEDKPKRSSRKTVEQPCPECFPEGWPATSTAVGCEHGTWTRD